MPFLRRHLETATAPPACRARTRSFSFQGAQGALGTTLSFIITLTLTLAFTLTFTFAHICAAQTPPPAGSITGIIIDAATSKPVEFITVTLNHKNDGQAAPTTATDAKGAFAFTEIPCGDYTLSYAPIGADHPQTAPATVTIDAQHPAQNLGKLALALPLAPDPNLVQLDKLQVTERKQTFYNTIDRKTYDAAKDLQATGGSASDLLQNVPSVQVDIEGNVSLRGDGNVLILIDGKTSALMNVARRAAIRRDIVRNTCVSCLLYPFCE